MKKKAKKVWDKIFPLKEGQKVKLKERTVFRGLNKSFTLSKGTKGRILFYAQGSPFIQVLFKDRNKEHNCYLEVKRVERFP